MSTAQHRFRADFVAAGVSSAASIDLIRNTVQPLLQFRIGLLWQPLLTFRVQYPLLLLDEVIHAHAYLLLTDFPGHLLRVDSSHAFLDDL